MAENQVWSMMGTVGAQRLETKTETFSLFLNKPQNVSFLIIFALTLSAKFMIAIINMNLLIIKTQYWPD